MDVTEAIRLRKSIRGFKPDPVSKEVIMEILEIATRAPSAENAQPWEITVVIGEVLDNIKRGNVEMMNSGAMPNADVMLDRLEGVYKERGREIGKQLFQLMGIDRENRDQRREWLQRSYRFLDAPVAIILSADSSLKESRSQFDIGSLSQTICLAALNYGLGSCINIGGVFHPEVVRKFTGIAESKRIVIAVAIGYPDWDFPANRVDSEREPLENITTWCGFN